MARRSSVLALALAVSLPWWAATACSKDAKTTKHEPSAVAPVSAGNVGADGVRRVPVEAGTEGYVPDRIGARPGEKLVLVFTRTADSSCISQLKTPDGKLVDLPKGTPVEVAVTVPQTGEIGFACGMDMFHGVVIAEKT